MGWAPRKEKMMRERVAVIPWRVLHAVSTVTSPDKTRPELQCVAIQRLKEHPKHGFVVATTGMMLLAVRQSLEGWDLEPGETILVPPNFLLPKKTFDNDEAMTIIQKPKGDGSELWLRGENYGTTTQVEEVLDFPNWERVLPSNIAASVCECLMLDANYLGVLNKAFTAILGRSYNQIGVELHPTQEGVGAILIRAEADNTGSILGLLMPRRCADSDLGPRGSLSKFYHEFWTPETK